MKRSTLLRTGLILASVCLAAWKMPTIIERVTGLFDLGGSSSSAAEQLRSATSGSRGATHRAAKKPMVISPQGDELSDAERERLLARARALAPISFDRPGGKVVATMPDPESEIDQQQLARHVEEALESLAGLPK